MRKFRLDIELYYEDGEYKAYISDNVGGSGIELSNDSPSDLVQEIGPYIYDYVSETDDEYEDDDDEE